MIKHQNVYYQGLGRRIRAHRLMRGVSQETLGEKLGVTFQQVQKYENGITRVSAGRLLEIADFLEVDPLILLHEKPPSSPRGDNSKGSALEFLENARALRLLQAFSEIADTKAQNLIVDLCQELARREPIK